MRKTRWGVLSTAKIAQTQLIPAMMNARNVELVGIASSSEKATKVASTFNIPLPNDIHKEWILKAANYGKHIPL